MEGVATDGRTKLGRCRESSETIRRTLWETVVKRWSDLHGDMQSQAEMTWPPSEEHPRSAVTPRRSLSGAAVGNLRKAVPSTRGPGRTQLSCASCPAKGTAGWRPAEGISGESI